MNQKQIRAAVEAMLFACGEPIGSDKLAQAVQLPQTSVENALEELRTRYTREDSGLCLLHLNTRWQLATKTEWADCVRRVLDSRRAEACSANFDKVRRYVKRLCTRVMPRTEGIGSEELRLLSAVTPKGEMFYQGTAQALADKFIVFRDDYGAVSRLLLELIRAEALTRGYHIITCPCAMHPEDKIDHILIPELKLAFLTDNRWHPVHLPSVQAVRCTRFLDRENLAAYRARLRFNERAAAELLEQASALMAQAKSCHDELETYYRAAVDFGKVDEAAAECMEMFGLK